MREWNEKGTQHHTVWSLWEHAVLCSANTHTHALARAHARTTYTHARTHSHTHTNTHTHTRMYACIRMHARTHAHARTHTHTHTHTRTHTRTHACILHTHMHACIHTYIHTQLYTHSHTHTRARTLTHSERGRCLYIRPLQTVTCQSHQYCSTSSAGVCREDTISLSVETKMRSRVYGTYHADFDTARERISNVPRVQL